MDARLPVETRSLKSALGVPLILAGLASFTAALAAFSVGPLFLALAYAASGSTQNALTYAFGLSALIPTALYTFLLWRSFAKDSVPQRCAWQLTVILGALLGSGAVTIFWLHPLLSR